MSDTVMTAERGKPTKLKLSVAERLDLLSTPEPNSGCILWLGALKKDGYGLIDVERKTRGAHRVSYELAKGPIPQGLQLDHLCRVRCCINPAHLEPVTSAENSRRGQLGLYRKRAGALITHCPRGHEYDQANTYKHRGIRYCRKCSILRKREYRAAAALARTIPKEPTP